MANRCEYSDIVLTREAGANSVGDTFKKGVSAVPLVGGLVAGLVPDTFTANVLRSCPGAVIDERSPYWLEFGLLIGGLVLLGLWSFFKFSKRK